MSPDFAGCHVPVDRRQRMGEPAGLDGWLLRRQGSDETIFQLPRSRPEMIAS